MEAMILAQHWPFVSGVMATYMAAAVWDGCSKSNAQVCMTVFHRPNQIVLAQRSCTALYASQRLTLEA